MIVLLTALLLQNAPREAPPPQACFAVVADAEGEMTLAEDPDWRTRALPRARSLQASARLRSGAIAAELKQIEKARTALYADHEGGGMEAEDFTSARSELEMRARALIEERDTPLLRACGV